MNSRLAHMLTRLYPRAWRKRYGAEFETLLQTGPTGLLTSANVLWAALCERVTPTHGFKMDQGSNSRLFRSWCVRAPWAVFGLAPLLLLAGAYFLACLYLWTGWTIFLPGADTPFGVSRGGPVYGLANVYFQAGKLYYFLAPVLVGWGIALAAIHQGVRSRWLAFGLVLLAWMGSAAQIQAGRTAVPRGLGHISMHLALGRSLQDISGILLHAFVIFSLSVLPWLIWRLQRARSFIA